MRRVTCDLCDNDYREEETEIIPLDHLAAYKARVCLDCIRCVAGYDDGEEIGTGIEPLEEEDELSD
jgi:hypothetical protein